MKYLHKKIYTEYIPLILAFIGILVCSIIFKQDIIKTIPVCFSLVIVLINSRANRFGFLLGSINCCIYIVGYFMEGIYGSVASTAFSAIMQMATFFSWKKRAYKQATEFKVLNKTNRLFLLIGLFVAWSIASFTLFSLGGTAVIYDGLLLILGLAIPIMQLFALIESIPLHLLNSLISCIMWIRIIFTKGDIANITYFISSIYGIYMSIRMAIKWVTLYKEQQQNCLMNNVTDAQDDVA